MASEIILNAIYNPAVATGIATVALIISLYVLYVQRIELATKNTRKKTTRAKRSSRTLILPRAFQTIGKDIAILLCILLIALGLFLLEANAEEWEAQKYIKLGLRYVQYVAHPSLYSASVAELSVESKEGGGEMVQEETSTSTEKIAEDVKILEEESVEEKPPKAPTVQKISPIILPPQPPPIPEAPLPILQDPPKLENPEASGPAPDAAVSAFSHYGSSLVPGGLLSFSVIVSNKKGEGEKDMEAPFNTQLFIDEENDGKINLYLARIETRALKMGEEETKIWRSAWVAKVGTHRAEVCADEGNVLLERNEKNNCAELVFTVQGLEMSGDLAVEGFVMTPLAPSVEQNVAFSAYVANKAPSPAKKSYAYLTIDGKLVGRIYVPSMQSGAAEKIESGTIWKATAGQHEYALCADGGGTVFETNEDNNCEQGMVFVPET